MTKNQQPTKIGSGHMAAMGRLGLRELRGAMYPESNVAQQPEQGTFGTLTPGEIAEGKGMTSLDAEQEKRKESVLEGSMDRADTCDRQDQERAQEMEMER